METLSDLTLELHGTYTVAQLIQLIQDKLTEQNPHTSSGGMGDRVIVSVQRGNQENRT